MIANVRTVACKPGKTPAALAFARQMAAFLKEGYQIDCEVLTPIGGNPQRIAWSIRYGDLAAMESFFNELTADPRHWELVNGAAECFIPGTTHDSIWKTL